MISHPKGLQRDAPFVFAELLGVSCSVCAPHTMTQSEVEYFAMENVEPERDGTWVAVDKAKLGLGKATPNPCNVEPDKRLHWFLLVDK